MKAKLKLDNPLWKTPERRKILDKAVQESAAELEAEIKQKILTGTKTGKLYRKGSIKRRGRIVGSKIHRASAPGEAPANDTGGLANSIRAKKVEQMHSKVATSKNYAEPLDKGATINGRNKRTKIVGPMRNRSLKPRPFFSSTADEFKPKFLNNLQEAIKENS
ncbi:MAG: hypothetical protein LUM44_09780 [Pyrinomonadaceae bacterium]|nr:hypothetical protein [Pyrinomonadaceae bacterium]